MCRSSSILLFKLTESGELAELPSLDVGSTVASTVFTDTDDLVVATSEPAISVYTLKDGESTFSLTTDSDWYKAATTALDAAKSDSKQKPWTGLPIASAAWHLRPTLATRDRNKRPRSSEGKSEETKA